MAASKTRTKDKKGDCKEQPPPTDLVIYVASTFPPWQTTVLELLKSMCLNEVFPDNKNIAKTMAGNLELQKYKKKLMPFAALVKEKYSKVGERALDVNSDMDEKAILEENLPYLRSTLGLKSVLVDVSSNASSNIRDECCPGKPFSVFSTPEGGVEAPKPSN